MKTPLALLRALSLRVAPCLGLAVALSAGRLLADPLNCDLSGYTAAPGLTAAASGDTLTVIWTGTGDTEVRAQYPIESGHPMVHELAIRRAGGDWTVLGQNLTPEFDVQTGHRRIDFAGLPPLRAL